MKNRLLILLSLVIGISFVLASFFCGFDESGLPRLLINSKVNSDILVLAPKGWNEFKIGEPVNIVVEVIGNSQVVFPNNYNLTLYKRTTGNWSPVQYEEIEYSYDEILLAPSRGDPKYYGSSMIIPYLTEEKPTKLRIIVTGYKIINGQRSNKPVSAFTDIVLFPSN
jgi:hypothetical protein